MSAEPIPVPNVIVRMTPDFPRAAPKRVSASPAASASFTMVTGQPVASLMIRDASALIHDLSTLAAVNTVPPLTTPGNVQPIGPVHSKCFAISATVMPTASGVAGSGVSKRRRSVTRWPFLVSTTAPLMPVPPISIPRTFIRQPPRPWTKESATVPGLLSRDRFTPGRGPCDSGESAHSSRNHASAWAQFRQ